MTSPRDRARRLREVAREAPDAVEPDSVLALLRHPERPVQRVAAEAFLQLVTAQPSAGEDAVERIAYLLRQSDPDEAEDPEAAIDFAETLLLSLARVAGVAPGKAFTARQEVLAPLEEPDGPLAAPASVCLAQFAEADPVAFVVYVDRFAALLDAKEPTVRRNAAHLLTVVAGSYPGAVKPALPALRERLDDPDTETAKKSAVVLGLAARENPGELASAVPALARALDAESRGIRANAAGALADVADGRPDQVAEATESLVSRLTDNAASVRRNAAAALSRLAAADLDLEGPAHGALIELLGDPDPTVRATACRALGKLGSPVALELLRTRAEEDEVDAVRAAAERALEGE